MRRTLTLLMVVLCFSTAGQAQSPTGENQTAIKAKKQVLLKTLGELKRAVTVRQEGEAENLSEEVSGRLVKDFSSDEELLALSKDIKAWKDGADKLPRRGPLYKAITAVYTANENYLAELGKNVNQPASTSPTGSGAASSNDAANSSAPDSENEAERGNASQENFLMRWLQLAAMIGTPLLAIGLFVFAFTSLGRVRRELSDANNLARQSLVALKNKQDALAKQLESLASSDSDLFTRLAELSVEIGAVNTRVQGLRAAPAAVPMPSSPYLYGDGAASRQPEAPSFPATAEAYLRKMQRHTTVVKPDFQNGILVADAENKGELALVQDESISHDSLFVIPRATQFQMKQDFYTYYERYYDCERPASGTVWIVDPAVVESVPGGWMLREKGVLEVR